MSDAVFRFTYRPGNKTNDLNAYDAAEALYGISRSISILTHYAIHRRVIKQAPSLRDARVLVQPPVQGSFEFIIPIIHFVSDPSNMAGIAQGFQASVLYDLTKVIYSRLAGRSEQTSSRQMQELARQRAGELDALADAVNEDVVRIQRPIAYDQSNQMNLVVHGGMVNIVNLDRGTYDYAKTKVLGEHEEEFLGHVQSFNGSTNQGRFWIEAEERTVGFSVHKMTRLSATARRSLSWSLDQWVSKLEGFLHLRGYPLSSKTGLLKHVYVTSVARA